MLPVRGISHLITVGSLTKRDYYFTSTVYRILAPMVIFKLMRRRLTLFDLKLNFYFKTQYTLAKILYHTFAEHITISEILPRLEYYPYGNNKTLSNRQFKDL